MTVRGDSLGLLLAGGTDVLVVGGSLDGGSGVGRDMGVAGGLRLCVLFGVLIRDSIWVVSIET